MSPRIKYLDQKLVTEFAEFRALKSKIEKWLKACRENFLEQLRSGFVCPAGGPFLIVVEDGGSRVDWKGELLAHLKRDFLAAGRSDGEADALSAAELAKIEIQAKAQIAREVETGDRERPVELAVKPNPAFAGKVVAAVVRKIDSRSARGF